MTSVAFHRMGVGVGVVCCVLSVVLQFLVLVLCCGVALSSMPVDCSRDLCGGAGQVLRNHKRGGRG